MYFNLFVIYLLRSHAHRITYVCSNLQQCQFITAMFFWSLFLSLQKQKFDSCSVAHLSIQMTALTFRANVLWTLQMCAASIIWLNWIGDNRGWKMPMPRYTQLISANWNVIAVSLARPLWKLRKAKRKRSDQLGRAAYILICTCHPYFQFAFNLIRFAGILLQIMCCMDYKCQRSTKLKYEFNYFSTRWQSFSDGNLKRTKLAN